MSNYSIDDDAFDVQLKGPTTLGIFKQRVGVNSQIQELFCLCRGRSRVGDVLLPILIWNSINGRPMVDHMLLKVFFDQEIEYTNVLRRQKPQRKGSRPVEAALIGEKFSLSARVMDGSGMVYNYAILYDPTSTPNVATED